MPVVQSRVNGIKINIPADARNIVHRFATKGGNELIFNAKSLKDAGVKSRTQAQDSVVIESEAPDNLA
jgi:hypothetical protein